MNDFAGFDVHAPDARVGAECLWARMRDAPELPRSEALGGFFMVTRFDDLKRVLLDPQLFSSARGITIPDQGMRSRHIPAEFDPPVQKRYRNLVARFFSADRVASIELDVRRLAITLIDGFAEGGAVDFVDRFARPFPVAVTLRLLGLPPEDAPVLDQLVVSLHEEVATGIRSGAADRLTAYVRDALLACAGGRAADADTLLLAIATGEIEGRALTLDEQVSMVRLILVGGFDTAAIALATALWWLAGHPEDAARLRADPRLIDGFSEDVVRFASPATYLRRTVTRDTELGGTSLRAGDLVVLGFGAANRDPDAFPTPDTIEMTRKPGHLGFGFGVHRCIGSQVAKLEMRVALEELLARFSQIALDPETPIRLSSGLNQGIAALSLRLS